jgi:hypothetical protein
VHVITMPKGHASCHTYLIIQAGPEAVIDISAPSIFDNQPAKATLQPFYRVVHRNTCSCLRIRVCLAVTVRTTRVACTVATLSLGSLVFVLLDLGVEARHDALQAPQSLEELCIGRLPALARGTTRPREDAFDFCAHTIGTWMPLVTLDLQW